MFKTVLRAWQDELLDGCLRWRYLSSNKKIVIASNGRSGSTMLWHSIAKSFVKNKCQISLNTKLGKRLLSLSMGYIDSLSEVKGSPFIICKTHDVWSEHFDNGSLYVYVHGDPLEAALSVRKYVSTHGVEWFVAHQNHLLANGAYEDLFIDDVLNYRGQLSTWFGTASKNVFQIAYEDLWTNLDSLCAFLGFDVDLPVRYTRTSENIPDSINMELFSDLRELRKSLSN